MTESASEDAAPALFYTRVRDKLFDETLVPS